jgi:hypothetical protein
MIEAQAATSLPTMGGHARSRVENFSVDHLASFKAAHTHVSGRQEGGTLTTQVTTTVDQLNILDVITADRIVLRLTVEHKPGEQGKIVGHIVALGSHFDSLRIAGYEVKVTLRHELLIDYKSYTELRNKIAEDTNSGKIAHVGADNVLCSLVEKIETKLPGVDEKTHLISVPHFGQVSLAEILVLPGSMTATMIRLDLGSPDDATVAALEAHVNGVPFP